MVTVGFRIPQGALEACKKQVEAKLATIVADVATKVYNHIILGEYPYWSGEYIASWNVSVGTKAYAYQASVGYSDTGKGAAAHYARPTATSLLRSASPYDKFYITNSAGHAMKIEYEGSPTQPTEPWRIAVSARNNTVGSYKFF